MARLIDGKQAKDNDVLQQLKDLARGQARVQKAARDLATGQNPLADQASGGSCGEWLTGRPSCGPWFGILSAAGTGPGGGFGEQAVEVLTLRDQPQPVATGGGYVLAGRRSPVAWSR
ncbi:MAG: hypothetical protein CM1200mP2_09410 [Planctomycetaceae bacterium]|nr:MAG: hypothetical protein CM1200mP2_09410 [Planctomycetaceae bacterium]